MKAQLQIEVRINQQGNYGNALTLGDSYNLEVSSLTDMAIILVKLHEACEAVAKQAHK